MIPSDHRHAPQVGKVLCIQSLRFSSRSSQPMQMALLRQRAKFTAENTPSLFVEIGIAIVQQLHTRTDAAVPAHKYCAIADKRTSVMLRRYGTMRNASNLSERHWEIIRSGFLLKRRGWNHMA